MLAVGFLTVLRLEVYSQVLAGPEGSKEGQFFASSQSWWLAVCGPWLPAASVPPAATRSHTAFLRCVLFSSKDPSRTGLRAS